MHYKRRFILAVKKWWLQICPEVLKQHWLHKWSKGSSDPRKTSKRYAATTALLFGLKISCAGRGRYWVGYSKYCLVAGLFTAWRKSGVSQYSNTGDFFATYSTFFTYLLFWVNVLTIHGGWRQKGNPRSIFILSAVFQSFYCQRKKECRYFVLCDGIHWTSRYLGSREGQQDCIKINRWKYRGPNDKLITLTILTWNSTG